MQEMMFLSSMLKELGDQVNSLSQIIESLIVLIESTIEENLF